jgi:two-component system cell cycle response regulator
LTTEAAERGPAVGHGARAALAESLADLENRPIAAFRTLRTPAAEALRLAREIGAEDLAQRAVLLQVCVMLRDGRIGEGGRIAHQVLVWAEQHDSPYVLARAHRELSVFYRLIGDMSDALTHGVQCVAHLPDDARPAIRARHILTLAVALDDSGAVAEGDRRYRDALRIAVDQDERELVLLVLNNMCYSAYENDKREAAEVLVVRMHEASARCGRPLAANELDTVARVQIMAGRFDLVEEALLPVLNGEISSNEGDATTECMLTLVEARRLAGRYDDAQEMLSNAIALADDRGLGRLRARAREAQAALHAAVGRYQEAYEEHRLFHADATALHSAQRDARARALQAVFEATEAREASEHFREMANRDPLTGLYNRRYVNERLPALLAEAAARRTPLSVAIVDLDHFKRINDTLSHSTGDTVLQHVGELLQESATGPAIAARMGGEEFLLIFPGLDGQQARLRCERLRLRIRAHAWEPITGTLRVTTSIGMTTALDGIGTPNALLSTADANLYAAKRGGRDRVVADSPDPIAQAG